MRAGILSAFIAWSFNVLRFSFAMLDRCASELRGTLLIRLRQVSLLDNAFFHVLTLMLKYFK